MNKIRIRPGRGHRETIHSSYGPRVTFKTLAFIPRKIGGKNFFVQSLNVMPNGRYAYIGYDHNPLLKHLRSVTKVVRFNLKDHRYKTSHTFRGGHGQALAYNPNRRSLWLLTDSGGPISRGGLAEVDLKSLKPMRRVRFRLSHDEALGDTLAFDNHNHVYNENRIWRKNSSKRFRNGIVVLYQGVLNRRHAAFRLVNQGLRHAPGNVIQALAYNSKTRRLYIEANDAIVSFPVNRLGRLRPQDVKETILRQRREYEGLSFDRKGYAYILMNSPKEIMKSTRIF